MTQSGAFKLRWILPSSNLDQDAWKNRNQEKLDHDVPPNVDPFLVSDVHGFPIQFSEEKTMALRRKPGIVHLFRNRAGRPPRLCGALKNKPKIEKVDSGPRAGIAPTAATPFSPIRELPSNSLRFVSDLRIQWSECRWPDCLTVGIPACGLSNDSVLHPGYGHDVRCQVASSYQPPSDLLIPNT